MFYYAQHTRQVTDFAGIKGPSKIGSRCHLAAARAVNELCDAVARLAPAAASQHYDCLTAADILQRINDISATLAQSATLTITCEASTAQSIAFDNKLVRSIINYRRLKIEPMCERGFFKGGYPFMFISPFDLKPKNNV